MRHIVTLIASSFAESGQHPGYPVGMEPSANPGQQPPPQPAPLGFEGVVTEGAANEDQTGEGLVCQWICS